MVGSLRRCLLRDGRPLSPAPKLENQLAVGLDDSDCPCYPRIFLLSPVSHPSRPFLVTQFHGNDNHVSSALLGIGNHVSRSSALSGRSILDGWYRILRGGPDDTNLHDSGYGRRMRALGRLPVKTMRGSCYHMPHSATSCHMDLPSQLRLPLRRFSNAITYGSGRHRSGQ
jgi:hypothetical protein